MHKLSKDGDQSLVKHYKTVTTNSIVFKNKKKLPVSDRVIIYLVHNSIKSHVYN